MRFLLFCGLKRAWYSVVIFLIVARYLWPGGNTSRPFLMEFLFDAFTFCACGYQRLLCMQHEFMVEIV
jgi:hypothetical protein